MNKKQIKRCAWAETHELNQVYHDNVWGVPVHDDRELFERLCLEGMQAGLSWLTILKKQNAMRLAFDNFDPAKVIKYTDKKVNELMQNEGIIRNRLKIQSVTKNAKAYYKVCELYGSLDNFFWRYVNHKPIDNKLKTKNDIPASTPLSDTISKDMKKLGFTFVGSTIIYAFMQSVGMVNDHTQDCSFRAK
ncbi:DNA-3-methyladenine glycosylase I [Parelusimicrobium proximum]|uniref:DNA-3-methyladenine glycosylase I n=1 Tax=Parelusimicrobium proximum TaxID=3228953 RepID=UPI003D176A2D